SERGRPARHGNPFRPTLLRSPRGTAGSPGGDPRPAATPREVTMSLDPTRFAAHASPAGRLLTRRLFQALAARADPSAAPAGMEGPEGHGAPPSSAHLPVALAEAWLAVRLRLPPSLEDRAGVDALLGTEPSFSATFLAARA